MCFGCSKEPSHSDGSFEYPQHMFWMRNKENSFQIRTLIWRAVTSNSHMNIDIIKSTKQAGVLQKKIIKMSLPHTLHISSEMNVKK